MRPRILLAALLAPLALAVAPAGAGAAAKIPTRLLWATVNVCDTATQPDTIGIRAQMPGDGRRDERMYLRFRVQYFDRAAGTFRFIEEGADSGFRFVGSAKYRSRQTGMSFAFDPPEATSTFVVRGVVDFSWRVHGKVIRRARMNTKHGHPSTAGADPAGYTEGTCQIRP